LDHRPHGPRRRPAAEEVDTERDADLLRSFDLDQQELAAGLGGQAPAIG
jgi:hypothetical protein